MERHEAQMELARKKLMIASARFANRHMDGEPGSDRRRECVETMTLIGDAIALLVPNEVHPEDTQLVNAEIDAALASA